MLKTCVSTLIPLFLFKVLLLQISIANLTNHIVDALAEELIAAGIMTEAEHIEEGIWKRNIDTTRVFNSDETPQFIHYGVDGTSSGLVAAKGDQSKKMQK